jgi:Spy/CpxP family protein refolding chaperone
VTRRAYFYFTLTFILGTIVGGAGVFYYGWYSGHWRHEFDLNRVVGRMQRDLSLDDSQVQKLRQILQESGRKRRELQQKNQPQFDALHEDTRNEIRKILNPQQLAKFNEHVRRSDERMKKQRSP